MWARALFRYLTFLASTCRRGGRVRRIGLMWRSPLGRGWVGMLMIGCVWDARSRLPLPTLFYWPEVAHLGDLLRLWVRPEARVYTRVPPDFQGQASATPDAAPDAALYGAAVPISDPVGFRQTCPLQIKKRQLFPELRPASPGSIASQLWVPTGGELRLQVREYWPDSLFVHYLDSGYFKTYIYLNTTYVTRLHGSN